MGRQGREKEFKIQNSGFKIQDSKFRIQDDELGAQLAKDTYERTPKRTRIAGLRGAKLRPAAVPFRNRKCMIQNSRFKMKWGCQSRLDIHLDSGRSLRRARSSGPAGRELRASAAGRLRPARPLARSILLATSPQPPIFAEIFCSNLDCAAVGSPQPPPGGGLLPRAAQKHARPLGCGLVLRQGQPL